MSSAVPMKFHSKADFALLKIIPSETVDGMKVTSTTITAKGQLKKNNLISVLPDDTETVSLIADHAHRFEDLVHLNIILTNACNLACSYCYEQHAHDYGRFTVQSLKKMYDFLYNANTKEGKLFQFFGGEPLIHKDLILDFLAGYPQELQEKSQLVRISIITNGTMLTEDFIHKYFQTDYVNMSISLDTDNKDVDHREVTQQDIDRIIQLIGKIPKFHKDSQMVSVRCTISRETAPFLKKFALRLYEQGLRAMVIHPLTMSAGTGNIMWSPAEWNDLHETVLWIITNMEGFSVQFSEGVGSKKHSNCMVGSDMLAVDASGDFSGCYFFTNQKAALKQTILGNILEDNLYTDRYTKFQDTYNQMFEEEEQCKTCDLKGFCYQCPAGNLSTGHKQMFRPDSMCKKIVSLFLDLQDDNSRKLFKEKYLNIVESTKTSDPETVFAKMVVHLMYKRITEHHLMVGSIDDVLGTFPNHEVILGHFLSLIESNVTTIPDPVPYVQSISGPKLDIREFYINILKLDGISSASAEQDREPLTPERASFYFTLVHMILLNPKGDKLQNPKKITRL